jgi:glycogen operon protein
MERAEVPHRVLPGRAYPLGATYDGRGVNFAIYSEEAHEVEVHLFASADGDARERIRLRESTGFVWHGYVVGVHPGQVYAYR